MTRLVTEWRIVKRVEEQFQALHAGILEIVPLDLIAVFDEKELELLIGGISEIDMDDLQKNTNYKGYTADDKVIGWFWKVYLSTCGCGWREGGWARGGGGVEGSGVALAAVAHTHDSASSRMITKRRLGCFSSSLAPRVFP